MVKTILTKRQQLLLKLLFSENYIYKNFYLTGGTALSEYYLHHRLSEDLDLFSFEEVNIKGVEIIFQNIKKKIKFHKIVYQNTFNRNIFFLHFDDEVLKTEFTYYPFEQIEKPKNIENIKVDSLIDMAVNKTDVIVTHPRSRDFIDLYLIIKLKKWNFSRLLKDSRIKFDTYIDPLQITQQLLQSTLVKDYPRMIILLENKEWQNFWLEEAKKIKNQILKT
ncbi:MAG: nucleotidyl transferase AbiEii/AbiGii toxin family protein [bacterium]|nr:nucleotidyl transferase AbiEii/AbiGii toxin family protein [bacterium]